VTTKIKPLPDDFPAGIPQHFTYMSEAQTRAVIEWLSKLPLKDLRERQALNAEQIGWCYDGQYYEQNGPAYSHIREGMKHLFVTEKYLDIAVQVQHFEGGVLSEELLAYVMWYQGEIAKLPLKPGVELPCWLA
jgi:hypothetical protein